MVEWMHFARRQKEMEKTVNFDLTGKVAIVTGGSRGLGVEKPDVKLSG